MKHLLNTLFILSENTYLSLKDENVGIHAEDGTQNFLPLLGLESIFCFSYKGASPALIGACAERGIGLTFLTPNGRFLARVSGRSQGNVFLRKAQYRISDSETESCLAARCFIFGKLYNHRWCLERTVRDHGMRADVQTLKNAARFLAETSQIVLKTTELDTLRGLEGQAANAYFGVFDHLILNQKDDFRFTVRSRRPPLDRVNAMLSFGYRLLASDCAAALESVGLDSYVGFMHRDRPGRESLALDLMEELRSVFVDRFVLTLINLRRITAKDFDVSENGAVLLNDRGRKIFLKSWQERKREEIKHPYLQEKMQYGLVPYVQALLLARYVRGDLDAYPAFLWK
ncbi:MULTISPECIES: type I-C CRISPR-associated endonuclease Cas1c [Caproicibacterium]|uniref:CRISPR-associated endonuclease Cas1 n=1 Tax=Caproicibacterium argilliputei TaxID=3030016 RepID=A0AA97DB08_9FIRM|nr:type I-C CRISPR-associated endonuclease Cas1c [Caproicibacterium argilliputei]WOC32937.1 type I-C CRISPR-associated endonuclease Cas1c [Caproicibacterium argilliputei]